MRDGIKVHKGSLEELVQNIKKYVSNNVSKRKLFEAFEKYQDSEKEITIDGLK